MKVPLCFILAIPLASFVMARELKPLDEREYSLKNRTLKNADYSPDTKVLYLTKLLDQQQKSYDEKISFLETELRKTKDRLIEKSMNQEKIEEAMKAKYSSETLILKRELAYKTKSLLDYQRQIEKMNPSVDLKNIIKINTELASELRRSEDKIAIMQLKFIENRPGANSNSRLPASVKGGK